MLSSKNGETKLALNRKNDTEIENKEKKAEKKKKNIFDTLVSIP